MRYQHNEKVNITEESYEYVLSYKRQLLKHITDLLNDLSIRFVISHGNLIECERGKPIYQDDDLDIRFCLDDLEKWETYCSDIKNKNNPKYNLIFDKRFGDINKQKHNGIQSRLITFENKDDIKTFSAMDIHCDLVASVVAIKMWMNYNIDFNNLRKVTLYDVATSAPNKRDTKKVLTRQYGKTYMLPWKRYRNFNL